MAREQERNKRKLWTLATIVILAGLLPFLPYCLFCIDEDFGGVLDYFQSFRPLIFIALLALIVLHLILMIFYKPARKIWPFIIYAVLFLATTIAGFIAGFVADYKDEEKIIITGAPTYGVADYEVFVMQSDEKWE